MWRGDRGVSPVIGVILMIAIVVILAAVVGTFALGTFDAESTPTPSVVFTYEYDDDNEELTVRLESGDEFESANVAFEQEDGDSTDTSPSPDWSSEVVAGDVEKLGSVESDDTVRIIWTEPRENGKTSVIGTWEGPDA